jgi:hypothetical protein
MCRLLVLVALIVGLPAAAADAPPPQKENFFKRAGKAIARDFKTGTKQAGKAYGDLGRSVGQGTVDTGKQFGREVKDSSKRTVKATKETF